MKPIAMSYFDALENPRNTQIKCEDPSLAVQASKDECDINVIIKKYLRTGELPQMKQAVYADLSEMPDLKAAMDIVVQADQAFMSLDANIRRRFDNDPVKLVQFASDDSNYDEAVKLGLVVPRPLQADPQVAGEPAPVAKTQATPGAV